MLFDLLFFTAKEEGRKVITFTPEEAAIDFLWGTVIRGDSYESLKKSIWGCCTSNYDAQVGGYVDGKKAKSGFVYTRPLDVELFQEFPIKDIMEKIMARYKEKIFERVAQLEKAIVYYNREYRKGNSLISDAKYDALLEELLSLEPNHPLLHKAIIDETPTERKGTLPIPMPSLRKVKSVDALKSWAKNFKGIKDVVITPKLDGLSIESNGKGLSWSRGDGFIGQRCDAQCSIIKDTLKDSHYTRGEMIIINSVWEKEKDKAFAGKKHPRNTVGGLVTGDYKEGLPYHLMTYMAYDLFLDGKELSKAEQLNILNSTVNKKAMPYVTTKLDGLTEENLHQFFEMWQKIFPVDGLVIEVNEAKFRKGEESDGTPSYAVAYKHPSFSENGVTTIKEVSRNINRWGVVSPIIEVEPIELSGATISRVSGVNMAYTHALKMYSGEEVTLVRSGEVIPKIVAIGGVRIPFREEFSTMGEYVTAYNEAVEERQAMPVKQSFKDTCPFCGEPLEWDKTGVNQVCVNPKCEERIFQEVSDFFLILGLENFSAVTLRNIYNTGCRTVDSILDISKEELSWVTGFAEKSTETFIKQMELLKTEGVPFSKLLHASGYFPNLGSRTIQLILNAVGEDDKKALDKEFLSSVPGVAEITADTFVRGFKKWKTKPFTTKVKVSYSFIEEVEEEVIEGIFSGERACFTKCRPTGEEANTFKSNGGVLVESVSAKTTLLVVKDLSETSVKTTKAKSLGVKIWSYQQFKDALPK